MREGFTFFTKEHCTSAVMNGAIEKVGESE